MTALLLDTSDAGPPRSLRRVRLGQQTAYDERWLQCLLFENPGLVPIDQGRSGAGPFIPLCREFALPRTGGNVFLDLLGLTPDGRLVLVECKLWRNPQARREVIAQILEYAALLRGWSYGDLSARLAATQGWRGRNPLFAHARRWMPDLDEAELVDGITASLARGDFQLVVAGDGIRSDLQTIAAHINAPGMDRARLMLLEIQLWADGEGCTVILPHVPVRTVVIEQRVLIAGNGMLLQIVDALPAADPEHQRGSPSPLDPDRAARRATNRAFWDGYIAAARFDHPDQALPRHGGDNWVRLALPSLSNGLTVYRTGSEAGLSASLSGPHGKVLFDTFAGSLDGMREESGLDLRLTVTTSDPFKGSLVATRDGASETASDEAGSGPTEDATLGWLLDAANRMVNLLRPRLAQLATDGGVDPEP